MRNPNDILSLSILFIGLALAAVAGIFLVRLVRRWAQRDVATPTFTFQDLRDMRARGQITEKEFVAMRNVLLSQVQTDLPPEPPPAVTPPPSTNPPTTPE